jgi:site-specific DNA recombinase
MMKMTQNNEKIQYFLYARKSSESEDRQIQSIDDQVNRLKKIATDMDLDIKEIYIEAKSAKAPDNRPIFNEMIQRLEAGEANGILCWQINRLSRNPIDSAKISWLLQRNILKSIQTIDRQYLPDDNVLLLSVESGVANQFILDLRKNTKRGLLSKLEKGWFPGVAPTGYLNDRENKTIVKDPERFDLVRKMWDLILTGNYTVPRVLDIANNDWGFRTKKFRKVGDSPISKSGLYRIFTNLFYAGIVEYDDSQYDGSHKPMITLEEFDRVQVILGRKGKSRPKKHSFAFTGAIKCDVCGCFYTAETKKKLLRKTGKINEYTYYHCTKKSKKIKCDQRSSVPAGNLELQIEKEIEKYTILPEFLEWALEALDDKSNTDVKDKEKAQAMRNKTFAKTQKELEELTKMRYKQLIDDDIFIKEKNSLQAQLTLLKGRLENGVTQDEKLLELTTKTFEFATYARVAFLRADKMGAKGLELKKEILLGLGEIPVIRDKKLTITPYDWLIPIKNEYPALEQEYKRLELDEKIGITAKTEGLNALRLSWLLGLGSNQQPTG